MNGPKRLSRDCLHDNDSALGTAPDSRTVVSRSRILTWAGETTFVLDYILWSNSLPNLGNHQRVYGVFSLHPPSLSLIETSDPRDEGIHTGSPHHI